MAKHLLEARPVSAAGISRMTASAISIENLASRHLFRIQTQFRVALGWVGVATQTGTQRQHYAEECQTRKTLPELAMADLH